MNRFFRSFLLTSFAAFAGAALCGSVHAKAIEGVVNINTASVKELTLLPGIGKSKAEQIVQMRQAKPFAAVEDLKAVKGLGVKRLEALRPHLVLNGPTTAKTLPGAKKSASNPAMNSGPPPPASPKI